MPHRTPRTVVKTFKPGDRVKIMRAFTHRDIAFDPDMQAQVGKTGRIRSGPHEEGQYSVTVDDFPTDDYWYWPAGVLEAIQ